MEGLKAVAVKSYNEWSKEEQNKAKAFFRELDDNDNGKVSFKELKEFGLITNKSCLVFDHFDMDTDGILDFEEILSLYFYKYKADEILKKYKPGKRRCNNCNVKQKLPDYSCFFCLEKGKRKSYNLCQNCYVVAYGGGESKHKHIHIHKHKHEHEHWCLLKQESLALLKPMEVTVLTELQKEKKDDKTNERYKCVGTTAGIAGAAAGVLGTIAKFFGSG